MAQPVLGLELNEQFQIPFDQQLKRFRAAGFRAFFAYWKPDMDVGALRRAADAEGMIFQSMHAPQYRVCKLWHPDAETNSVIDELLACLRDCAAHGVPIMVVHAFCGFGRHEPTEIGLRHYDRIAEEAARLGVKIAIENAEGNEYLDALMNHFKNNPWVGFCWDSGHEMCYNRIDLLEKYGDQLLMTHLNDNMGATPADGTIIWKDDLHLLPFDGVGDWEKIAQRLNRCGYDDILMFELKIVSLPDRTENDKYAAMPLDNYLAEAFQRALRVAALKAKSV